MTRLICFDMDGVLFEHGNFWIELHKAFGTWEEGKQLTQQYLNTNYPKLVEEVIGRLWKGKDAKIYIDLIKRQKYCPTIKIFFHRSQNGGKRFINISLRY